MEGEVIGTDIPAIEAIVIDLHPEDTGARQDTEAEEVGLEAFHAALYSGGGVVRLL